MFNIVISCLPDAWRYYRGNRRERDIGKKRNISHEPRDMKVMIP